jgi:hypothetical protein
VRGAPAWRGADASAQGAGADGSDFVRSLVDTGRGLLPDHSRL